MHDVLINCNLYHHMNKEDFRKINGKTEKEFLSSYNYSFTSVSEIGLDWAKLVEIHDFYKGFVVNKLELMAQTIFLIVKGIKGIHSIKYRVKDPEHLVEKIIRKKMDPEKGRKYGEVTVDNFMDEFDDLIGFRILHLFKTDWEPIFTSLRSLYPSKECPVAYHRKGDDTHFIERCKELGVKPVEKEAGYRSIHYIAESSYLEMSLNFEIQIRTVFEEAWSEIDHLVRYPNNTDDELLNNYLLIFNKLVGSADDMGVFLMELRNRLSTKEKGPSDVGPIMSESKSGESKPDEDRDKNRAIGELVDELGDRVAIRRIGSKEFKPVVSYVDYISRIQSPSGSTSNMVLFSPKKKVVKYNETDRAIPSFDTKASAGVKTSGPKEGWRVESGPALRRGYKLIPPVTITPPPPPKRGVAKKKSVISIESVSPIAKPKSEVSKLKERVKIESKKK